MTDRHPVTGRFLAHDCEIDCLEHCAGLCGFTAGDVQPTPNAYALTERGAA